MRVSDGYSFDALLSKVPQFYLNSEALLMHVPAIVKFAFVSMLNLLILVESCIYKHMKGPFIGTKKDMFLL